MHLHSIKSETIQTKLHRNNKIVIRIQKGSKIQIIVKISNKFIKIIGTKPKFRTHWYLTIFDFDEIWYTHSLGQYRAKFSFLYFFLKHMNFKFIYHEIYLSDFHKIWLKKIPNKTIPGEIYKLTKAGKGVANFVKV